MMRKIHLSLFDKSAHWQPRTLELPRRGAAWITQRSIRAARFAANQIDPQKAERDSAGALSLRDQSI
jgi:hypothetical protein